MQTHNAFQTFFMMMGPFKWPLVILSLVVLSLIIHKTYRYIILKKSGDGSPDAILFWGSITAVAGILGQVAGIWQALRQMLQAPDISPHMMWMGFLSSFVTTLYGIAVLIIAALVWWGLRNMKGI